MTTVDSNVQTFTLDTEALKRNRGGSILIRLTFRERAELNAAAKGYGRSVQSLLRSVVEQLIAAAKNPASQPQPNSSALRPCAPHCPAHYPPK